MVSFFLQNLNYERRLSKHTFTAYQTDLQQFIDYLEKFYEIKSPEKADFLMVRSWIVFLVENNLEKRSVNRKIATLRAFYKFLVKTKKISIDPMLKIRSLKTDKPLPKYVEEKPLNILLESTEFEDDLFGTRDRLIIELFYATGIRLAELIGLEIGDVNLYNNTIKVFGKRSKERIIPLTDHAVELIKKYLGLRTDLFQNPSHQPFIITDAGDKAYPMFVQRIVKKYLNLVTSQDKKSPHVLRHSFATHLLNRGADINAIKDLMGHESLAATQIYTHNSIDKLKKIHKQAHPKA